MSLFDLMATKQEQIFAYEKALKEARVIIYNLSNNLETRNPTELIAVIDTVLNKYKK